MSEQSELAQFQTERWAALVEDCKSRQGSINVGGKAIRQTIIDTDHAIAAQSERVRALESALSNLRDVANDEIWIHKIGEPCKCKSCCLDNAALLLAPTAPSAGQGSGEA